MAIKERKAGNGGILLNFIPKLGAMYVVSTEALAAIKAATAAAGMGQTDSYTGYKADTPSGAAIKALTEQGIKSVEIDGTLADAKIFVNQGERDGKKYSISKLMVTLEDAGERYNLSLDLGQSGNQMLVRKLAALIAAGEVSGKKIEPKVFASYDKSDSDGKFYTNYGASLKANGAEVPIPKEMSDALVAVSEAAKAKGESAGLSNEIIGQIIRNDRTAWHLDVAKKIETFFASRQAQRAADAPTPAADPAEHEESFELNDVLGQAAAAEAADLARARAPAPR